MLHMYRYNWLVREEWFEWCKELSNEQLLETRAGGVGSILQTLFHIVDVECSWIRAIEGKADLSPEFADNMTLDKIRGLSGDYRQDVEPFVASWSPDKELEIVRAPWMNGEPVAAGEVLRHLIAHEIHHAGQLSVWARGLGRQAVSANLIGRGLLQPDRAK
ncbi:DinB family protein [Paenibacillus sp. MBLB4367]|uniref:DinB family protein n=1 Tax=Paenibacillus sp. MBLB4367 TaxID=3384767 RepID=UPI0039080899